MHQQPPNQQPNTYYPPQQPPYQPQWPQPPVMPPQPPKKKVSPWLILGIIMGIFLLLAGISYTLSKSSPALSPAQFRASAQDTTVENLDKDGNADKDANVHFTCKILRFVKDDSGNTTGATVQSGDTTTSFTVIQVIFPSGTDLTKLNEEDTLEVWGTDQGVYSGQNALGGTVQEVEVSAVYMTDTTTGYGL